MSESYEDYERVSKVVFVVAPIVVAVIVVVIVIVIVIVNECIFLFRLQYHVSYNNQIPVY